ncbi:hypothetical protein BB558_006717, partial [Smittium angustum]
LYINKIKKPFGIIKKSALNRIDISLQQIYNCRSLQNDGSIKSTEVATDFFQSKIETVVNVNQKFIIKKNFND